MSGVSGSVSGIEYNEARNALLESDDQGAMELWGNPTYRGVIFRHNRFTDCRKTGGTPDGQAAIRLDDTISGMLIYGNVFIRCGLGNKGAVHMRHGRDNIIDNNLFVGCNQGISGGWDGGNPIWQTIIRNGDLTPYGGRAAFITNALYLSRYPAMATMLTTPGVNHVWRNVFCASGPESPPSPSASLDLVANAGCGGNDPGFVDAGKGDWRLKPDAAPYSDLGFRPIPFDEIGIYQDAYRAGLPGAGSVRNDKTKTGD